MSRGRLTENAKFVLFEEAVNDAKIMFRLKQLREEKSISQLKLATDLNMNQNSISRYETEQRQADYQTLIALADYFNVSIDYLLGRTDVRKKI